VPISNNLPLTNEDTLNLKLVEVSAIDGAHRITDASSHLLLNGAVIPTDLQTIPKAELDLLHQEVAVYTTSAKKCLTVLKIYFGAQINNNQILMQLFYQPLFLAYSNYEANTHNYMYDITESGTIYYIENGTLTAASDEYLSDAQQLFKDKLTIKHTLDACVFEPFNEGVDIESLLIPFQSIFTILQDNDNTQLMIKSSVNFIIHEEKYPVKQSVLLFSEEVNPKGAFAGKFANRPIGQPPYNILGLGFDLLS
jgi:hypothetical protein